MKIAHLRKRNNLTQADLAQRCETSQQQIAKIEGGIVDPRLSTLRRLAQALNCQLPDLFYSEQEFLAEIRSVVRTRQLDLSKIKLIQLNALCAEDRDLPAFHPLWETVQISGGTITIGNSNKEK